MSNSTNELKHFVTCRCEHCGGGIEFEADDFEKAETRPVNCPHCYSETKLFVTRPKPPVILEPLIKKKQAKSRNAVLWMIAATFVLVVGISFAWVPNRIIWEKSNFIRAGEIELKIESVSTGGLLLANGEGLGVTPTENYLLIQLAVMNLSSNRTISFRSWRSDGAYDPSSANLTDNFGNSYKPIVFDRPIFGYKDESTIYPQNYFREMLVFEVPVQGSIWLHLELPASKLGKNGAFRFEIAR